MLKIQQIKTFVKIAELRSFRKVAEILNTTQPNVSARIATLEAQLEAPLFFRDAGRISLTPKGEALLPHARAILFHMDALLEEAEAGHLHEGVLRLGITELIVHRWLPKFLSAFKAKFPQIEVELYVDLSSQLSPKLHDRQLDLTFQSGPFKQRLSGHVELPSYPMCWVGAPALQLGGAPLDVDKLASYPILTHAKGTVAFEQITNYLIAHNITNRRVSPSTNMIACLEMAKNQLGIACLPAIMVADAVAKGELEVLCHEWVPDDLQFAARFDADSVPLYISYAASLADEIAAADRDAARG